MDAYKTKDWVEAAILFANGLKFSGFNRVGEIAFFTFNDERRAQDIIECYLRGDLEGNIKRFTDAQKKVKDLIYK